MSRRFSIGLWCCAMAGSALSVMTLFLAPPSLPAAVIPWGLVLLFQGRELVRSLKR